MPSTITEFTLHPSGFFERRADRLNGFVGTFVAVVTALSTTLVLAAVLWSFSQQFDGTTTVDNPAYPGDQFCGDEFQSMTPSGCSEPATRTVEVRSLLWDQVAEVLPVAFVGLLVFWLLLAAALHVGALLGGGDGRFGQTLALAAWGLVPAAAAAVVGGAALVFFAARADLSTGNPETLLKEVQTLSTGLSGAVMLSIQLGGAAWQAYLWTAGLRVVHGLSRAAAVAVAGLTAAAPVLLG